VHARVVTAFVLLVWAILLAWANVFVGTWAQRFPIHDDATLWSLLPPLGEMSWEKLIAPYNVHFLPLPRLVHWLLYRITGDLRASMFLQVELLGAISLAWILAVRRVRGSTGWTDVLFPLLFLQTGNAQNLLGGFQIALTLPTVLASGVLVAFAWSPGSPGPARAGWIGASLAALPLCGGAGSAQAPALVLFALWVGVRGIRSAAPHERAGGRVLLAAGALALAALAAGFLLVATSEPAHKPAAPETILLQAAAVLSLAIGPAAGALWPASAWIVLGALAVTLGSVARDLRRRPEQRLRNAAVLAASVATLCLAVSLGFARAEFGWRNGFQLRYVTLAAPLLAAVVLAWSLRGESAARAAVPALLALAALYVLPSNARIGLDLARTQASHASELDALVRDGARANEVVQCYTRYFYPYPARTRRILQVLAGQRRPPFDRAPAYPEALFDYLPFDRAPSRIEAEDPPSLRELGGDWALLVRGGTRIHLALKPGETRLAARLEVPGELVSRPLSPGVRVRIQALSAEGGVRTLGERDLDPVAREADRGAQTLEVEVPSGGGGEVLLVTESLDAARADRSWVYFRDVAIH
jgi:hypothetical protein